MQPICDYHMHTYLCGHASGQPEDYAQQAIQKGLKEIGFSDHAPLLSHCDPTVTMDRDQLPDYCAMIEQVRDRMQDKLKILVGIEADFLTGYEEQTAEMLKSYSFDYVIGSVHFIQEWAFDNPAEKTGWDNKDTNKIYRQYFEALRSSAQTGLFDIMGHIDLVKKFGHRATEDISEDILQTAEVFKQAGVAIEINTSGLRKPVKEIYPSLALLKFFCEKNVPVTFGSDSHAPEEVGYAFDQAVALAKEAGYKEYVTFSKRKIHQMVGFE